MKVIIFDSSSIISLAMNGLLDELKELKKIFKGEFLITKEVKQEVVDNPIKTKKYELEAIKIDSLIKEGYFILPEKININEKKVSELTFKFLEIANTMFVGNGQKIKLIQDGEASCLALSKILNEKGIENVLAIDERTTRILIEKPENLHELLEKKLHVKIKLKESNFNFFKEFKVIRSTEIIYVAYKKGLINLKNKNLLDALLYALKFKGCAISEQEIEEIKSLK